MKLSDKLTAGLTATQRQKLVDAVVEPGRHPICPNLVLCISKAGKRHYEVRAIIAGTKGQNGMRDGIAPTTSLPTHLFTLAQAEDVMRPWVLQCQAGNDPRVSDEQLKLKAQTLQTFWATYATDIIGDYSAKEQLAWHRAFKTLKPLHGKLLHQIDINAVEAALKPIYAKGDSNARRTRHKLERIFKAAKARKLIKENPAVWDGGLKELNTLKDNHTVEQHPCLEYKKLPAFMRDLHHDREFTSRILEIMILTTTRSQEVRGMRWEEIDWDNATWSVPAERTKMNKLHIVPLPRQVIEMLKALGVKKEGLVFPSRWGVRTTKEGHVEGNALVGSLRDRFELKNDKGETVKPHGIARSTFRDYISEERGREFPEMLMELQLAHGRRVKDEQGKDLVSPTVVRAYARMTKVEERRVMMQAYADYALAMVPANNVVQLRAA